MKRIMILFSMLMLSCLAFPVLAYCGDGGEVVQFDPASHFASLGGLVAAVLAVTQMAKNIFKSLGNRTKYLSWLISLLLSCTGYLLNLGLFEGMSFGWMLLYALSAGLVANSVFDLHIIKGLLALLKVSK